VKQHRSVQTLRPTEELAEDASTESLTSRVRMDPHSPDERFLGVPRRVKTAHGNGGLITEGHEQGAGAFRAGTPHAFWVRFRLGERDAEGLG
jgi:hypothetical protein